MTQRQKPGGFRLWVEWRAGRIEDPVSRLRYLQTVAPERSAVRTGRSTLRRAGAIGGLAAVVVVSSFLVRAKIRVEPPPTHARQAEAPVLWSEDLPQVWLVERTADSETYSNGLRVDNRYAISTHPRSFRALPADRPEQDDETRRTEPVGIVFHTTESLQAPFEADQNQVLKQVAESIVEFVRRHRAYNFLIDRFGRVYRIVQESDAADHAGYSVWSDAEWIYVNLNESFLGVSFEAKTQPGQEEPAVSPAQVRAAATLTEMLRSRYKIRGVNCVTHAQVSVNPSNMLVGWHTDWASSFPFEKLGLPDNYARPLPALTAFGFEYDETFVRLAGTRLYAGVEMAEERLREQAAERGLTFEAYRKTLQRLYREKIGRFQHGASEGVEPEE
ncbi:MAG TPA: peptidoglycan recognition family protein [Bryobacteraceae bacterium]|nr:peptidoglycan recognition family protein [Bryobacteraceae bacterium]